MRLLLTGAVCALAACGSTPELYPVAPVAIEQKQRIAFRTVEVRDVSLPAYAAANEIAVEDTDGRLITDVDVLWADSPQRAISLELARNLARISGARVAPEPWPFEELPEARVDVRFETLLASANGQFRASGQYFVSILEGGSERSVLFDLAVPYDPAGGPGAVAAARGRAIAELALAMARTGMR